MNSRRRLKQLNNEVELCERQIQKVPGKKKMLMDKMALTKLNETNCKEFRYRDLRQSPQFRDIIGHSYIKNKEDICQAIFSSDVERYSTARPKILAQILNSKQLKIFNQLVRDWANFLNIQKTDLKLYNLLYSPDTGLISSNGDIRSPFQSFSLKHDDKIILLYLHHLIQTAQLSSSISIYH